MITNINFNDLIPNFRVYYIDGDEIIARTIQYIRNPRPLIPNVDIVLEDFSLFPDGTYKSTGNDISEDTYGSVGL